jgi:hypothetical protein
MKRVLIISCVLIFAGCSSDNAPDCLKSTGKQVTQIIKLPDFTRLTIFNEFNIKITEGAQQSVSITIGENILKEINFDVIGDELTIKNNISCKWTRGYEFPTVEITHPNISFIKVIGGSVVSSDNTLNYPDLTLTSRDSNGDFNLNLNCVNLTTDTNELTNFRLKGMVSNLNFTYSSGDGRFDGSDLLVTNANIIHNGTNQVVVSVVNSLTGEIGATGDLIYINQKPAEVIVNITNRGRLIDGTN